jgi:MFS family permease
MKHYITLLQNEPVLRRLSLIQLISYFGAWFSNIAIYTLLVELDVSAFIIALVAAFHFLPGVLQAPISGVLIDKFSPKKLMLSLLVIEIIATFFLLLITSNAWIGLLFLLVFIRMGAASFYFTLEMSLLPKIIEGKSLQYANEIHSIIWSLSYTLGMAMSGFLVYKLGVQMAFIVDGMIFILAFFLLLNLEMNIEFDKVKESFFTSFKGGLRYLKNNRKIIHLILIHATVGLTVFDAIVALMAKEYYASLLAIPLALGIIHATRALALVIGPLLLGKWINSSRLTYLFLFQGLAVLLWANIIESFYLSLLGAFVTGLATTTLWSYTYTLLQTHTDKAYYGRVVAYNDMVFLLTASLSSFAVGVLIEMSWSIANVLSGLSLAFFVATLYYLYVQKNYDI